MTRSEFDDTVLMAYADGVLEPEEARRVLLAAEDDPEVAARIEMFRETGALLGALGAARPMEPLSEELTRRVDLTLSEARGRASETRGREKVLPFPASRTAWRPAALAASIALVAGVVGGIVAGLALRETGSGGASTALLDDRALPGVLDTLPAGAREAVGTGEVEIIASFVTEDGAFCREFELALNAGNTIVSVACREGGAWAPQFAVVTAGSEAGGGFAPASALATLDAFLSGIGAGPPLSPEDEAARLSATD